MAVRGRIEITVAAGSLRHHAADVRNVLMNHLTPAQMDLVSELADQVEARLAEIARQPDEFSNPAGTSLRRPAK